ncbi:MAG: DUF4402 domain-containing protein [Aquisalinus sp.]|nr:DUF4402 domain-containing protein [Aquisalinus sp.]
MKLTKLSAAVAVIAMSIGQASAADVDVSAGAKIIAPLQLSNATALYFGTIAPSLTDADTVVVSPSGAKTCGVELTCLSDDHTAAQFNVTGEPNRSYTIQLPDTIQISNGSETMTVDSFTGSKAAGTLASGTDSFSVGGTLEVAANQASGEYTGTFVVSVEYQ